jgi:hypothetical protein
VKAWYWWVLVFAFAWPVNPLLLVVASGEKGPPGGIAEGFVFVPMGLLTAAVLAFFMWQAETPQRRASTAIGYLVVSPCALFGALMSGLIYPQPLGTMLYGAIPLVIGTIAGFLIGSWLARQDADE